MLHLRRGRGETAGLGAGANLRGLLRGRRAGHRAAIPRVHISGDIKIKKIKHLVGNVSQIKIYKITKKNRTCFSESGSLFGGQRGGLTRHVPKS